MTTINYRSVFYFLAGAFVGCGFDRVLAKLLG